MDSKINLVPTGALGAWVGRDSWKVTPCLSFRGTVTQCRTVSHSQLPACEQNPLMSLSSSMIASWSDHPALPNENGFLFQVWKKPRGGWRGVGAVTRLWAAPPIQWWMERRWWSRAWWWSIWQAWLHPVCLRQEDWSSDETHRGHHQTLGSFMMDNWDQIRRRLDDTIFPESGLGRFSQLVDQEVGWPCHI